MQSKRGFWIAGGVAVCAVVLLTAFQNCGQDLSAANSSATGYSTSIAFPLAAKTDLFGYMSCDRMPGTFNRSQYFSFRVRANGGHSGIQPSSTFNQFISSSGFNVANQAAVLENSGFTGATLQFSTRVTSSGAGYLFAQGLQTDSLGIIPSWGALTLASNVNPILSNGTNGTRKLASANMMFQISGNSDNLGGHNDSFTNSAGLIQQLVQNTNELVLGYTSANFNSGLTLLNPAATITQGATTLSAYGSMFQPTFAKPYLNSSSQTTLAGQGYNTINALNEYDLSTTPATLIPGWVCQNSANQFLILPYNDAMATSAGCMTPEAAQATTYVTTESLRRYNAANAILNDGVANANWIIDATNNCVFPAQAGSLACYDSDGNGTLDGPFIATTAQSCGGTGEGICPHFFTFCSATR